MDYGREMWGKQNEAENERMALQNQWNKEAAAQSVSQENEATQKNDSTNFNMDMNNGKKQQ